MLKKISLFILGFVIIFSTPVIVFGANWPLVQDCTGGDGTCNFDDLMSLINRVISFVLIDLATPLFALIIVYTGWLYLSSSGNSENIGKAKKIFKNALIGYVIALAAWLIVKTILNTLGFTGPSFLG